MPHMVVNDIGIEYEEYGRKYGKPFLLICGFTRAMTSWPDSLIEQLVDNGYRVIVFDNRDIGLSHQFDDKGIPDMRRIMAGLSDGSATDLAPYTLNDMAKDAAELLKALDASPAIVMGTSMGGMIAQLLALEHPECVKALIPTMTTARNPEITMSTPEAGAVLMDRPANPTRNAIAQRAVTANRVIGSGPTLQATDAELRESAAKEFDRAYRPAGISRQYAAITVTAPWHERLKEIDVPTLVLHGEKDTLILPANGRDVAGRIPGARYVEIPDWGHDMPPKAVPELLKHILPFAESVQEKSDVEA
ncbi:MAG: alpha/beta hydrolase [Ponticaulis sp.]|nr:alpha/beta hydrolase [Ponticaulis sp.]